MKYSKRREGPEEKQSPGKYERKYSWFERKMKEKYRFSR
jgi:hypothetical protein